MKTESQIKRSRDGYAAGHRDGVGARGEADAPDGRAGTGDESADTGYRDGVFDGADAPRVRPFAGVGRVIKDVFWLPGISTWLNRRAGTP
jgi:hypothetical protein